MRDFNSGNIGGDVHIHDNSTENKLLVNCTNEELFAEETHRKQVLAKERKRKNGVIWKFLAVCATGFLFAAGWYFFQGHMDAVTTVLGASSVLMTAATLQNADKVTEFELRQIHALKEISMILRERGARW